MRIKLKTYGFSQYYQLITITGLFLWIGGLLIFYCIKSIYNNGIELKTVVGLLLGLVLYLWVLFLIATVEKRIIFEENNVLINLIFKNLIIQYEEIEHIKFVSPPREGVYLMLKLKKRKFYKKVFIISVNNNKENLLGVLNHSRIKGVKTGLNEIGEKYFAFLPDEGKYVFREDKKIDIRKLW